MHEQQADTFASTPAETTDVLWLYRRLLTAWNERNANAMAEVFATDGIAIGFDGSSLDGREEIAAQLGQIFADHQTGVYVPIVRDIRFLSPDVAMLRAVAGLIPHGQTDVNPNTNAIQTLIAVRQGDEWSVALYQNTPAAFHGRPEVGAALTEELQRSR